MKPVDGLPATGWRATLELGFKSDGARTWLARRRHSGPLVVQRPFFPEGPTICQAVLVHPPAGIAGGDVLEIDIDIDNGARVQLTTPGAGKWYRGFGRDARQTVNISVARDAVCEWLPQENIVFDGSQAAMTLDVKLENGGVFCGWDFTCLGRPRSGERFENGTLRQRVAISRGGRPQFRERACFDAEETDVSASCVLGGHCSYGSMFLAGISIEESVLEAARKVVNECRHAGVTRIGETLVARWVGQNIEAGRALFTRLWAQLRPIYLGRDVVAPRIWNT